MKKTITVQTDIKAPIDRVWECYTDPEHVTQWNNASPDWHTPSAINDLRPGGKFVYRMEAKDGLSGFDFEGVYGEVKDQELITYTMPDGRHVKTTFRESPNHTHVVVSFDAEHENSPELQREGWQAILDNFKKHVEECE